MQLRMWSYDLAREQNAELEFLRRLCEVSLRAGYNALGLYLEHRFNYPSAPWIAGRGALDAATVQKLSDEFPELQLVPFVNLLGHMEGVLFTSEGQRFAEERFRGMQACPSSPEFAELADSLLDDVLEAFSSDIVHIGADEIGQLGRCSTCKARMDEFERENPGADGKAMLLGSHFRRFATHLEAKGRTAAVWGDMFPPHPEALNYFPKSTLIFDWQYFSGPQATAPLFTQAGYRVVVCPTLNTYASTWMHLAQAELNVTEHAQAANEQQLEGVCLTTWECELFGNYETLLPAITGAGRIMLDPPPRVEGWSDEAAYMAKVDAPLMLSAYRDESAGAEEWARLMGLQLPGCGGIFAYSQVRSALKARLLLYSNPFLLWLRNRQEFLGAEADRAMQILDRAISVAPDPSMRGASEFVRIAIEFVRHVESASIAYGAGNAALAAATLAPARTVFDDLTKIAKATALNAAGSLADIERCKAAKLHVERVIVRIKEYGYGALGYLPSFETLCHPKFIPYDQGNWWLINDWANE